MDDNYTYDGMCSEESEFVHYGDGENYADDYVHHSVMGQLNYNDNDSDFVNHAALYGAYLASKESCQKTSDNKAGTSSSASNDNTNCGQLGCMIFAIVIIILGLILSR